MFYMFYIVVFIVVFHGIVLYGMVYSGRKLLVSFSGQYSKSHPYLAKPNGPVITHH